MSFWIEHDKRLHCSIWVGMSLNRFSSVHNKNGIRAISIIKNRHTVSLLSSYSRSSISITIGFGPVGNNHHPRQFGLLAVTHLTTDLFNVCSLWTRVYHFVKFKAFSGSNQRIRVSKLLLRKQKYMLWNNKIYKSSSQYCPRNMNYKTKQKPDWRWGIIHVTPRKCSCKFPGLLITYEAV